MSSSQVDDALSGDITLQQFLASAPMFKWLDKYFLAEEDQPMDEAPIEQEPAEKDSPATP